MITIATEVGCLKIKIHYYIDEILVYNIKITISFCHLLCCPMGFYRVSLLLYKVLKAFYRVNYLLFPHSQKILVSIFTVSGFFISLLH